MAKNERRIWLFRLIPVMVFLILLVILSVQIADFFHQPGDNEYGNNDKINQRNTEYARGNPFGFTDRERTKAKPKGIYRIAVLGDSFIWGDGIKYEDIWSHKLEKKILAKYDSVEVMHWGKRGWSTLDEFNFFKEYGKDYDIDLLLIGWVDNDPDMGTWKPSAPLDPAKEYPLLYRIFPSKAIGMVNSTAQDNYTIWMNKLYSHENLKNYKQLLSDFHNYLSDQKTVAIFFMTPGPFSDDMKARFDTVAPIIRDAGFRCVNLYEPSEKKLGHYSTEQLQANPANGHPGKLMTEEFAIEALSYLEDNRGINMPPRKIKSPENH